MEAARISSEQLGKFILSVKRANKIGEGLPISSPLHPAQGSPFCLA